MIAGYSGLFLMRWQLVPVEEVAAILNEKIASIKTEAGLAANERIVSIVRWVPRSQPRSSHRGRAYP